MKILKNKTLAPLQVCSQDYFHKLSLESVEWQKFKTRTIYLQKKK